MIIYRWRRREGAALFSMLAVGYLFLGGAGAGALVVLSLLEIANARRRFGYADGRTRLGRTYSGRAMGPLRFENSPFTGELRYFEGGYARDEADAAHGRHSRRTIACVFALPGSCFSCAWPVCLVALAVGILCLMADLGHPERVFALVAHPQLTVMTVGAYALVVGLIVAATFSVGANFDGVEVTPGIIYALSAVGVAAGFASALYTGVLLAGMASVLFWQTWILPVVFAVSSLSCGTALVFLAAAFVQTRQNLMRPLLSLARFDSALILLEAVAVAALLAQGYLDDGARLAAEALLFGDLSLMFWGGVVVLGLVVPFAMERFVRHANYSTQLMFIAAAVLLGGFLLRVCVVGAAEYDVTQMAGVMYGLANATTDVV